MKTRKPVRLWLNFLGVCGNAWGVQQIYLKPFFFTHELLLVFVYLMGDPRQLFFFQCGPKMPKGWTPLLDSLFDLDPLRISHKA